MCVCVCVSATNLSRLVSAPLNLVFHIWQCVVLLCVINPNSKALINMVVH